MIVAMIALMVSLGGSAVALQGTNTVRSDDIVRGQVKSSDVGNGQVRGVDVANGRLTGTDLANGSVGGEDVTDESLTGADVSNEGGLGSLGGDDITESSLSVVPAAANSLSLGGVPASAYYDGCDTGAIHGFAHVNASAAFSATFTGTGVSNAFNCTGGTTVARRVSAGVYRVRFNGLGSAIALGVVDSASAPDAFVSIDEVNDGGAAFEVQVISDAGANVDVDFFVVPI
jgi:hypothetical protein